MSKANSSTDIAFARQLLATWDQSDFEALLDALTDDMIYESIFGTEEHDRRLLNKTEAREEVVRIFLRAFPRLEWQRGTTRQDRQGRDGSGAKSFDRRRLDLRRQKRAAVGTEVSIQAPRRPSQDVRFRSRRRLHIRGDITGAFGLPGRP